MPVLLDRYQANAPDLPEPKRWTREEFHRALDADALDNGERLELIDGELYEMAPQSRKHAKTIMRTSEALRRAFASGYSVETQVPTGIADDSEPEPDVIVIAGDSEDYDEHPTPEAIRLIVEVSESSLAKDRIIKGAKYAQAGIPEYWIIVLNDRRLEVRRDPGVVQHGGPADWRSVQVLSDLDTIAPLAAPHSLVSVGDLLPKAANASRAPKAP